MVNWKKLETENKILGLWHFLKSLVTHIELFRKIVYKTQRMENDRKKDDYFFIFSKTFRSLSKSESKVKDFAFFEKIVYKTQRMDNHRYFVLDSDFTFVSNEKYFEKMNFCEAENLVPEMNISHEPTWSTTKKRVYVFVVGRWDFACPCFPKCHFPCWTRCTQLEST